MNNFFIKFVLYCLQLPLNVIFLASVFIPKKKDLWLVSAWFGEKFLDNPKYVFKELVHGEYNINAFWIVKDKSLLSDVNLKGYPVVYAYSLKGIWLQLRAGAIVFSHSIRSEFTPCLIAINTVKVQTWHGVPIKKIGYDDKYSGIDTKVQKTLRLLFPFLNESYDLVVAASEEDKKVYHTAFKTPLANIRVTGYPRNDEIFRTSLNKVQKIQKAKKIIYMPTLRGGSGDCFELLSDFDFFGADKYLNEMNALLYIKLHPVQLFKKKDLELINQSRSIKAVFNSDDIYESLGDYDVLITDYSGIYFDFLITGKPIVMAPIDYDHYVNNDREVYYDYESICPAKPCNSWTEIFQALEMVLATPERTGEYDVMRQRFHKYMDDSSSKRVIDEIKKILDAK